MASIIDICNMALTLIGEPSITSLDEGTVVSNKCNSLWIPSRDTELFTLIADRDSTQRKFFRGWVHKRVVDIADEAGLE